jgi:tetratricopeptide (TPR) repeat protein
LREWGVVLANQGRSDQAEPLWNEAGELLKRISGRTPEYGLTFAKVLMVSGNVRMAQGKTDEADALFEQARGLVEGLVRESPDDAYRITLAEIRSNQGMNHLRRAVPDGLHVSDRAALDRARHCHEQALAIRKQLFTKEPDNPNRKVDLAASHNHLGNCCLAAGAEQTSQAEGHYREALALLEPLAAAFPSVAGHWQDIAQINNNLIFLSVQQSRLAEAESVARRAIDLYSRLSDLLPRSPEIRRELGMTRAQLAQVLEQSGRAAEFKDVLFEAVTSLARAASLQNDKPQRDKLVELALTWLKPLADSGYFQEPRNRQALQNESAFSVLRERPELRRWLGESR